MSFSIILVTSSAVGLHASVVSLSRLFIHHAPYSDTKTDDPQKNVMVSLCTVHASSSHRDECHPCAEVSPVPATAPRDHESQSCSRHSSYPWFSAEQMIKLTNTTRPLKLKYISLVLVHTYWQRRAINYLIKMVFVWFNDVYVLCTTFWSLSQ